MPSFPPPEDLYADGQPPGQVVQEIYGCGAAFAFVCRSYHRLKTAPLLFYCEYSVFDLEETDDLCFAFRTRGIAGFTCRSRLICLKKPGVTSVSVRDMEGIRILAHATAEGDWEFQVPAATSVEIRWEDTQRPRRKLRRH